MSYVGRWPSQKEMYTLIINTEMFEVLRLKSENLFAWVLMTAITYEDFVIGERKLILWTYHVRLLIT